MEHRERVPPPAGGREEAAAPGAVGRSGFLLVCVVSVDADALALPPRAPRGGMNRLPSSLRMLERRESFNSAQIIGQETGNPSVEVGA